MNNYSSGDDIARMLREDPIGAIVVLAVSAVVYFLFLWLLYSRFGYRGKVRLFLTVTSLFPAFAAINLLIVSLITSPNEAELKKTRKQVKQLEAERSNLKG